jgi:hypothetical protein
MFIAAIALYIIGGRYFVNKRKIMCNQSLIISSTVNIKKNKNKKISDPKLRLKQYKSSLKKWLSNQDVFQKIVWVENSDFDLSYLSDYSKKISHKKKIEFISYFSKENEKQSYGGFGELEQINKAVELSDLVGDFFYITGGRNFVKNIKKIHLNTYDIQCNFNRNLVYTNSEFWGVSKEIFRTHLYPIMIEEMNKGAHFEQGLAMGIHSAIIDGAKWSPILPTPINDGYSAAKGTRYMQRWPFLVRFIKDISDQIHYKNCITSNKDGNHYYDVTKI